MSPQPTGNITVLYLATSILSRDKRAVFWTCTKSQNVCSESRHSSTLLHPASPPSATFFHRCLCQKPVIKCTHLDLYSSIVPWQHFTPPPLLLILLSLSLPPFLCHRASFSRLVNICIVFTRPSGIQIFLPFENSVWQENGALQ